MNTAAWLTLHITCTMSVEIAAWAAINTHNSLCCHICSCFSFPFPSRGSAVSSSSVSEAEQFVVFGHFSWTVVLFWFLPCSRSVWNSRGPLINSNSLMSQSHGLNLQSATSQSTVVHSADSDINIFHTDSEKSVHSQTLQITHTHTHCYTHTVFTPRLLHTALSLHSGSCLHFPEDSLTCGGSRIRWRGSISLTGKKNVPKSLSWGSECRDVWLVMLMQSQSCRRCWC